MIMVVSQQNQVAWVKQNLGRGFKRDQKYLSGWFVRDETHRLGAKPNIRQGWDDPACGFSWVLEWRSEAGGLVVAWRAGVPNSADSVCWLDLSVGISPLERDPSSTIEASCRAAVESLRNRLFNTDESKSIGAGKSHGY